MPEVASSLFLSEADIVEGNATELTDIRLKDIISFIVSVTNT